MLMIFLPHKTSTSCWLAWRPPCTSHTKSPWPSSTGTPLSGRRIRCGRKEGWPGEKVFHSHGRALSSSGPRTPPRRRARSCPSQLCTWNRDWEWNNLREKSWWSDPLAGGVVRLPLFNTDRLGHIVADWEGSGKRGWIGFLLSCLIDDALTCDDRESLVSTRTPKVQRIPRSVLQSDSIKKA